MSFLWMLAERLTELFFVILLFRPLPNRIGNTAIRVAVIGLFGLMMTGAHAYISANFVNIEYIYGTFFYYPVILLFLLCYYRIGLKYALYGMLLVFLTFYSLRGLLVCFSVKTYGANFLTEWHPENPLMNLLMLALYAACDYALVRLEGGAIRENFTGRLQPSQLAVTIVTVFPVLYIGNMGIWSQFDQHAIPLAVYAVGLMTSLGGIFVVVNYNRLTVLGEKNAEIARMEGLLHNQAQQYAMQKETVDLLNRHYHDLKNQLLYLSGDCAEEDKQSYITEIREEIDSYTALKHTNNETLDVILSAKALQCEKKKIRLLLFLDGSRLSFIRPLDLTVLFGNALDNAIRAVEDLPEADREIVVRMTENDSWLTLKMQNPFNGTLNTDESGELLSDKTEGIHGLGLKNIRRTMERYHANITVAAENGTFILRVLIPKQETADSAASD